MSPARLLPDGAAITRSFRLWFWARSSCVPRAKTFRDVVHLKAEAAFGRAVGGGGLRGAAPEGAPSSPQRFRIVLDPDVVRVGGAFGLGVVSQSPAESAAEEVR